MTTQPRLGNSFRRDTANYVKDKMLLLSTLYPLEDCLRIDLHCHDKYSDTPDELWGRLLRLPESWLTPEELIAQQKRKGCTVHTVTNHNNADSCWYLQEKGVDVLSAAEFTCFFPEHELYMHVLCYGFDRQQELKLLALKGDIHDFLKYCHTQNLPVILPHPLYFYTENEHLSLALFEQLAVMFQNFEVLNGQRDMWQSALTMKWLDGLTPNDILAFEKKHGLQASDYGVDPNKPKGFSGGSDDHMGLFSGECGSYLYIPNLTERLKHLAPSELALEALRNGHFAPFGDIFENHKLNIALLDYTAQIATNIEDPGLIRLMLHRGGIKDKIATFIIGNLLLELQGRKNTRKFFKFAHATLHGQKPSKLAKWAINKDYHFTINYLEKIAAAYNSTPSNYANTVHDALHDLFTELQLLSIRRLKSMRSTTQAFSLSEWLNPQTIENLEIPLQISQWLRKGDKKTFSKSKSTDIISEALDKLTFPILTSAVLLLTFVASTRALYANRGFINKFSGFIGAKQHPKRALYLTDTLLDKNGVSNSLSGKLRVIQQNDLPVDFLICHADAESQDNLHVVRPIAEFAAPEYGEQPIRIPDIMEISRIFYEGGYDRIVCSTEGPMAVVSLIIKFKFGVPSYFFMHTDWMDFVKHNTQLDVHNQDRVRRILRALYTQYDGIFCLNREHKAWLEYQVEGKSEVFLTAHHAQPPLEGIAPIKKSDLFPGIDESTPVLFIACRISREKGVFELADVMQSVRSEYVDAKLVIAGTGPDEKELQALLPDAKFLGWVDKATLAACYQGLDAFIFPSTFDTFGNVILEAFSYGMPVISYNCKGPAEIIQHKISGLLADDNQAFADCIVRFLQDSKLRESLSAGAKRRCGDYQEMKIMNAFMRDLGLTDEVELEVVPEVVNA